MYFYLLINALAKAAMEISGPMRDPWSGKMISSYKLFSKKGGHNYRNNSLSIYFKILVVSATEPIFLIILVHLLLLLLVLFLLVFLLQ